MDQTAMATVIAIAKMNFFSQIADCSFKLTRSQFF